MDPLSPAFLGAWATQIGSLSAFLGGFAATVLVTLLMSRHDGRVTRWTAVLAASSAVAFVVAAVATTTLVAGAHPDAPAAVSRSAMTGPARALAATCFALGAYALLAAIGCSGWLRSKGLGVTTTTIAVTGAIAVTTIVIGL